MLTLSRGKDEEIVIRDGRGGEVVVKVNDIRNNKVRIGIEAPIDWSINRREVQDEIDRGNGYDQRRKP